MFLLDYFIDYQKPERVMSFQYQNITVNVRAYKSHSTAGWEIFVLWKDQRTAWERLADLKECYPVYTSESLVIQKVDHDPAFNWWVNHALRKRDRIVAKLQQRGAKKYVKTTMKFGIECPKTVDQDLALDKKNGNTL